MGASICPLQTWYYWMVCFEWCVDGLVSVSFWHSMGRKDVVVEIMQSTQEWTMPKFMCVCFLGTSCGYECLNTWNTQYVWVQQHREYRAWQTKIKIKTKPEQTKNTQNQNQGRNKQKKQKKQTLRNMQVLIFLFIYLFFLLFFLFFSGDSFCRFVFFVILLSFYLFLLKSTFSVLHGVITQYPVLV